MIYICIVVEMPLQWRVEVRNGILYTAERHGSRRFPQKGGPFIMPNVKIVNGATGKVLDVPGADPVNGVQIQQWNDLGNPQQKWRTVQAVQVAVTHVSTDTGDETLKEEGTNQYTAFHMQTVATLDSRIGLLSGTTRSTSDYDLKGFT